MEDDYAPEPRNNFTRWTMIICGVVLGLIIYSRSRQPAYTGPDNTVEVVSVSHFNALVGSQTSKPALLKFHADWCGPCRVQGPIYQAASGNADNGVQFLSLNVDNLPALAQKYGVSGIPCIVAVDAKGNEVQRAVGVQSDLQISDMAEKAAR